MFVLPLLAFVSVSFVLPIFDMLFRSVDNPVVSTYLPKTIEQLTLWKGKELPKAEVFETLARELLIAKKNRTIGKIAARLNFETSGMRSAINKTVRKIKKYKGAHYKEALIKFDKRCLLLAFPVSYLLATLPLRISNILMVMVLLPFWTSLLVRTTSWIVLLQRNGVVNDIIVWLGIIDDGSRIQMVYNQTGTLVAMTQILLPFMILPLYSVMKTISPSYMKAARSLGASPLRAFARVYVPQTVPGIGAGCLLVFILSIGYYITPALVGGQSGQLISNFIAYHMKSSLNWGLAAALGTILLFAVLSLYWLYNKIVGIDNMKLG